MNSPPQQQPRILAYRVARQLNPQECQQVSGGTFFKMVSKVAYMLKTTSYSGPDGGADDCKEPT